MTSPQALPDLARELVDRPAFATLATLDPDGRARQCVMWVGRDGDELLLASKRGRRQVRNLQRDPRATLLLFDPERPTRYVEIRGLAIVEDADAGADARRLIERLSRSYTGRTHDVPADAPGEAERCVLRVRVQRTIVHGDGA